MTAELGATKKDDPATEEMTEEMIAESALGDLSRILMPLQEGDFSARLDKVLVYAQSAARSKDARVRDNFIRFARLNLDSALVQALQALVFRPRLASRSDEQKRAEALQMSFDRMEHPEKALLDHYIASSDPLNKYLAAGPWGHEYLKKRGIDSKALEAFDVRFCELLGCNEAPAGRIVLAYSRLSQALERLKE